MYKPIGMSLDLARFLDYLAQDEKVLKLKDKELSDALKPKVDEYFSHFTPNMYNQERIEELKSRVLEGLPEYVKIENEMNEYRKSGKGSFKNFFLWYNVSAFPVILLTGNLFLAVIAGTLTGKLMQKPPADTKEKTKKLEKRVHEMIDFWQR